MALALAAAVFFLLHMLPTTPLRPLAVRALGEKLYTALFSLLAFASIVWLVIAFNQAPYGLKAWYAPQAWYWLKLVVIYAALVLMVAGVITPNPSALNAGGALKRTDLAEGIFAITRHPLMWGFALWAGAHLISQANFRGFVFFGTFLATALIGSWLQQQRKSKILGPTWDAFAAKTSFVPFVALLQGRTRLKGEAVGPLPFLIAFGVLGVVLHFHLKLFGQAPLHF